MVQEKLEEILKQIADTQNITNYEVCPDKNTLKGNGFLSEGYTGEVINKDTGFKIQTYIKVAPSYGRKLVSAAYFNECYFYSKIFPEVNEFQIKKGVKKPFNNVPIFYCGDDKEGNQYIAMQDLKFQKYDILEKSKKMSEEYIKLIFEIYGKFHALSFAFKDQNAERFAKLTKPLQDVFETFREGDSPPFNEACNAVKEIDTDIYKNIEPIQKNWGQYFIKAAAYDGKYSGIVHGDCWSNNMVFKFLENGEIEDMKLLDFQLCRVSTPIHDLSYFFYSGASKEEFMKLDEYLELYHKSFSAFAKELGSDPEKLLPLNDLKLEWKKYSFLGIYAAIMLWQNKLMSKDKIEEITSGDNFEERLRADKSQYSDAFKNNTSDILIHANNYGIIDYILTH